MIVKKMPILQGFLDLDSVKKMSNFISFDCGNFPVFYDIETTGLSRYSTFLYLIGALTQENNSWFLYQWIAENQEEEPGILCEFINFLKSATSTIQYNGKRFDQPYLEERYKKHNLPCPFKDLPGLDLYQELKSCKDLLKLDRMKQPDMEHFLGLDERIHCDGGQCIRLYKAYAKNREPALLEIITGHNEEDLLGLGRVFSMLAYRALFTGEYQPLSACFKDQDLILKFRLPFPVPAPVSKKGENFYITLENQEGALLVTPEEGRIRQYYGNYKDYDYIPGEDTAVPKILSRYMDRSLKKAATPENCYTWFVCDENFTEHKEKQSQYLNSTLPCLLKLK